MRRLARGLGGTVAMLVIAVAALPFGPLSGNWGGAELQVSATPSSIVMMFSCGASVHIAHGLLLDGAGGFTVLDSLRGSLGGGPPKDTLPDEPSVPVAPALITGTINGESLTISLRLNYSTTTTGAPITFTGRRGGAYNSGICRD